MLEQLRSEHAVVVKERDALAQKLSLLREKHEALLRRLYGKKSESYRVDLPLFDDLADAEPPTPKHATEAPDAEEPDEQAQRGRATKSRQRGATRLPPDIRRVIEDVEPTAAEALCPCCGEQREVIGYEETEKLEYQPANIYLRVIRRPKLVCRAHEEAGVATPDLPPQVLDKALPGASMLAQVITAKYRDHLPLHRQAGIYGRQGVDIARSTMCDWVASGALELVPIVVCMLESAKRSGYVSTDDTGVTLLRPSSARGGSKRAHLWAYLGEERGDVVFDFTPGRDAAGPRRVLADYKGFL